MTTTNTFRPQDLWDGFWGIHLLHIGQTLGLFQALEQPATPSELASTLHLEPHYIELWCLAARASGLLQEHLGRFQAIPELLSWTQHSQGFTSSHLHLTEQVLHTFQAIFTGRALPEPPILLRMILTESLSRNYAWAFQEAPASLPAFAQALSTARRALEVGCGMGLGLSALMTHHGHIDLYGLESDYECAREAERNTHAVIHVGDLPRSHFNKTFDLIICFRTLSSSHHPQELLTECRHLLEPTGWLLLATEIQDPDQVRKHSARSLGEHFAYQLLTGHSNLRFFHRKALLAMLEKAELTLCHEIQAPDWATPLLLCQPRSIS